MTDIINDKRFLEIQAIDKGWSGDKKYRVKTVDGKLMFLRVSDISELTRKKNEYDMMERAYNIGVLTPQPIEFDICDGGKSCYSLTGWLEGKDVEAALPTLTQAEQYTYGLKAGVLLKKIHSVPAPDDIEDWGIRFSRKIQVWLEKYKADVEVHSETGDMLIRYLDKNRGIISSRPQTFIHGDFNTENIIITPNGEVGVIDFNSYNSAYGDPWRDINNVAWTPTMYPHFYSGQIDGYFNSNPPSEFWNVLAYYLAYDALAALTDPYELNGIEDGMYVVNNIMSWTNSFTNPTPTWYLNSAQ